MLCDPNGKVAVCDRCGQIHSPHWPASKSAVLHARGTGHHVVVAHARRFVTFTEARPC